ncbi:sugar phosphate isomerase/epimerase [Halorubrum halophilum]|uniref:sugar phosphate isomerase/epimerase family protein n=1 Tax=Halorubrum halophilum TaxID=413816 RepID=UPI00186B0591|nr:sugar phosphate isomerase/epimerase [Halorubrum halophilum]
MTQFGFQLYSLRDVDDSLPAVLDRIGATPFTGVEFAGLDDAGPAALATTLADADLSCAGMHVGLDAIETDPEGVAATARELGCRDVVVPWLDPEHFASVAAVEAAADRLTAAADALASHDIRVHYHNHDQEFVELGGRPALTHLIEAADGVGLELDVGWAGAAGQDPLAYLSAHADRISLVHLKDYDAASGETVTVGTGDLPLARTVDAVSEHGVEWLIYEAEDGADSYETLEHAAAVVDDHA